MNVTSARLVRFRASVAAVAFLAAAACSDKSKSTASTDSALAKDLALAGQQTAQPTFQDTAIAPAPTTATVSPKHEAPAPVRSRVSEKPATPAPRPVAHTPQPQPTPAPVQQAPIPMVAGPAPIPAEIGSGTSVALTSGAKVCTSTNLPGDKIVATVNEPVTGSNGAVIPAGSTVVLEVASVNSGSTADSTAIVFRVKSLVVNDKMYTLAANVSTGGQLEKTKVQGTDPNADKKKVIGGAIAGALIGQLIGHNTKGTIIGAAAGAATGAVVAKSGEKWEGCLPAGAPIHLTLTGPLVMQG
ncbi:MAG TPA: YMGG-like glycine zipper-containing protein [Gemmatimonadaceae bacterium]